MGEFFYFKKCMSQNYRFNTPQLDFRCPHLHSGVVCAKINGLCAYMLLVLEGKNVQSTGTMNDGGCGHLNDKMPQPVKK